MNKKILGIPVLILTFALLSIPVMGAPATKIEEVTMTVENGGPVSYDGYPRWVSDDTILLSKGGTSPEATVTLVIPGVGTYNGPWYSEWIAMANWKKDPVETVINAKHVMTFEGGTFEGVNQRRITGPPVAPDSIIEDRSVYQGTGIFKGWTLKLSREGTPDVITEGYLILPK